MSLKRKLKSNHGSKELTHEEMQEEDYYRKKLIFNHGMAFGSKLDEHSGDPIIPKDKTKVKNLKVDQ